MNLDFTNRVAIVTGGASGIGAAICKELAGSGAKVVVADLNRDHLNAMVAEIRSSGGTAEAFVVDVADAAKVEEMVSFAEETFGRLDLAVNNAGIGGPQAMAGDYPLEGWKQVIDVNLNGVFFCMKYEIMAMQRHGGGAIVNMSSILGSVGFANAVAYTAAKHALVGMTKVAALDHAKKGIRINAVGPAFIDTPLISAALSPEMLGQLAQLHPIGRIGKPEEVAALTCFLLSDRASFINGSYHLVDGGYTAQ